MNKKKIGKDFEREALEFLKGKFDKVEWLSEKKKSTFDFKCEKNNQIFYGDAKVVSAKNNKPLIRKSQREV